MGSSELNTAVKGTIKDIREEKYYNSTNYMDFSKKINTQEYWNEEKALKKEIITSMTLFHSYMSVPAFTTRFVHAYCFL